MLEDVDLPFVRGQTGLVSASAEDWYRLIAAVGPPAILVAIDSWLGSRVRGAVAAEDVWQETLLEAWRNRAQFEWQGVRAFRRWLLTIARHRVAGVAEELATRKRGGHVRVIPASVLADETGDPMYAGPARTTTPSQVARDREVATAMQSVLSSLPADLREVVALYLFEDLTLTAMGERLGLTVSAVRHRIRRGVTLYRQGLVAVLDEADVPE